MEGKMELESEDRLSNLPVEGKQEREIESEDRLSNLPGERKQKMEIESEDRLSDLPGERKQKMEIESEDRLSNLSGERKQKMKIESEDRLSNLSGERKQKMKIESEDRLSNLLEEVQLDILSFLNTKDAVRTSILSKYWRNVWKDLKDLKDPESMHLQGFTIKEENFFPKFFSSCPHLQSLKLNDIFLEDGFFRIASDKLKRLEFSFVRSQSRGCQVIIDAPKLTIFSYEGSPCLMFDIPNHSLEEVYFDLNWNPNVDNKNVDYHYLMIMLRVIRRTKSLTLSLSTIKILSEFHALVHESKISYTGLKNLNLKVKGEGENFDIPPNVLDHFRMSSTSLEICRC